MSMARFYAPQMPTLGPFTLDEVESHHLKSVLRIQVGEQVVAFDGLGGEAHCEVSQVGKRWAELTVLKRTDVNRELASELHLYVGLPKGDRQRNLIDSLVQLGVTRLTPLITSRGVAQPVETTLVRLRRQVIETSKQCGRNRRMEVLEPVRVEQLRDVDGCTALQLMAHPYGESVPLASMLGELQKAVAVKVLIGPEGGFTEAEVHLLVAGNWRSINLGKRILRVEVAATCIASVVAGINE
jgi:16S rRNA (uracil1498-N3)-methyltransferase